MDTTSGPDARNDHDRTDTARIGDARTDSARITDTRTDTARTDTARIGDARTDSARIADTRTDTARIGDARIDLDDGAGPVVGVRELRAHLTDAVRRAGAGHRTIVTSHGRPIAQLGPLDESAPALDQLIAAGALVAPRRAGAWRPPEPVPVWSGVRIDRALRELRG